MNPMSAFAGPPSCAAHRLRKRVIGAVREGVTVDDEQRSRAGRGHGGGHRARSSAIAAENRSSAMSKCGAKVSRRCAKRLVIVESPAKARTIAGYLGGDYAVGSSVGHVRDLPDRRPDVPEAQRKRFGALGVDVERRASSRTTSSIRARRRSSRASRSCSRTPTSCCSRRTRTARARRSPGISSRC